MNTLLSNDIIDKSFFKDFLESRGLRYADNSVFYTDGSFAGIIPFFDCSNSTSVQSHTENIDFDFVAYSHETEKEILPSEIKIPYVRGSDRVFVDGYFNPLTMSGEEITKLKFGKMEVNWVKAVILEYDDEGEPVEYDVFLAKPVDVEGFIMNLSEYYDD